MFLTIELVYLQGKQENHTASVKVKPPTRSPSKALQRPRTRALLRPEPPGATAVRRRPPSSLARLQGSCSPIFTEAAVETDSPSQPRPCLYPAPPPPSPAQSQPASPSPGTSVLPGAGGIPSRLLKRRPAPGLSVTDPDHRFERTAKFAETFYEGSTICSSMTSRVGNEPGSPFHRKESLLR